MEIVNLLFGHSRGTYEIDRIFQDRFQTLLKSAGYDGYGVEDGDWYSKSFIVRLYRWGDDDALEVDLPNFECHQLDLKIKWYKCPLRDSYSNIPFTEEMMCSLEEILSYELKDR